MNSANEMYVQSFGSGSCGNALLVQSGSSAVLIDCGVSPRFMAKPLSARNLSLNDLDAILLTHEHDDHVRGLATVRSAQVPIYATEGTSIALALGDHARRTISFDEPISIGALTIRAIPTSHDAAQPCGYSVSNGSTRVTVLTDLGETDDACGDLIEQSELVVIEANHDVQMLRSGPYPDHLKRRVLSGRGHLSNDDCGAFLRRCFARNSPAKTVWLAHLSATNNRPSTAVRAVERQLAATCSAHQVVALPRRECGPGWHPTSAVTGFKQLGLFA